MFINAESFSNILKLFTRPQHKPEREETNFQDLFDKAKAEKGVEACHKQLERLKAQIIAKEDPSFLPLLSKINYFLNRPKLEKDFEVPPQKAAPKAAKAAKKTTNTFEGVKRSGTLNCWAIALVQMLRASPELLKSLPDTLATWKKSSNINCKDLRKELRSIEDTGASIDASHEIQEDISEALLGVLNCIDDTSSFSLSGEQTKLYDVKRLPKASKAKYQSRTRDVKNSILSLGIDTNKDTPFSEALNGFFEEDNKDKKSYIKVGKRRVYSTKTSVKITKAPKQLFLSFNRFTSDLDKIDTSVKDIPIELEIDKKYFKEDSTSSPKYSLKAFSIHQGNSLEAGHYVTVVKHKDGYYLYDDDKVKEVSDDKCRELLEKAYLVYYSS